MKAAVVREHGAPDRLNFETDFPDPKPGPGDVIVAVKAPALAEVARSIAPQLRPNSSRA